MSADEGLLASPEAQRLMILATKQFSPSQSIDNDDSEQGSSSNINQLNDNSDGEPLDKIDPYNDNSSTSDILFQKKDVSKSRTQLFQLVLSTASLKLLKQQHQHQHQHQQLNNQRSSSIISNGSTIKRNFQLFIQAPVLLNVLDLKGEDDVEIGQQLPFEDKPDEETKLDDNKTVREDEYDLELLKQQQSLTMNALKKLSLLPIPIQNSDPSESLRKTIPRKTSVAKLSPKLDKILEPYQPAEVDLSSFASLTRQPKHIDSTPPIQNQSNGPNNSNSNPRDTPQNANTTLPEFTESQKNRLSAIYTQVPKHQSNIDSPDSTGSPLSLEVQKSQQFQTLPTRLSPQQTNSRKLSQREQQYHSEIRELQMRSMQQPVRNMGIRTALNQQMFKSRAAERTAEKTAERNPEIVAPKPQSHKHLQQIKGFRSPMYVPAVLRRTQVSDRTGLMTERSNGFIANDERSNSTPEQESELDTDPDHHHTKTKSIDIHNKSGTREDENEEQAMSGAFEGHRIANNTTHSSNHHNHNPNHNSNSHDSAIQHNSTSQSGSNHIENSSDIGSPGGEEPLSSTALIASFESTESTASSQARMPVLGFEDVSKQAPTRRHWLKDESVAKCGIQSCNKYFNFFERRHHCRKCGGIYCNEHTSHYLYINQLAQFTTGGRGTLLKVCDYCIDEYNEFIKREFGVEIHPTHSIPRKRGDGLRSVSARFPSTGTAGASVSRKTLYNTKCQPPSTVKDSREQLVGSVPANWSWSSF